MADDALAAWHADDRAPVKTRCSSPIGGKWPTPLNIRIHPDASAEDAPTVAAARGHRLAVGDVVITRQNTPTSTSTPHTT